MASDRQRPKSCVRLGSMPAHSMAIAPPARKDFEETSSGRRPIEGPSTATDWRRASVTMADVMVYQRPCCQKQQSGTSGGALCSRRCSTRRAMAFVAHAVIEPEHPWPITSPGTQFFCMVYVRAENVEAISSASEAVSLSSRRRPMNRAASQYRKGREPSAAAVYSPGLLR